MRVIGTDVSERALDVARANATSLGMEVAFVECSWAGGLDGSFDLIVSNPPYVTTTELAGVERDVRDFEPHGALLGGEDGLDAYRALLTSVREHATTARLMLEVDPRHAGAVAELIAGMFPGAKTTHVPDLTARIRASRCRDAMSLDAAIRAIRRGGVVVIPTDTVYGLACDPSNTAAVSRIYAIKRRPDGLELTLLAASLADLEGDVDLSPAARTLAAAYWPGALSIINTLKSRRWAIPRDGSTLSVRVPAHPLVLELLRRTGPLATTSANRHGEPTADTAAAVTAALGAEVDAVVDGGRSAGLASTIIDCTTTTPRVLRDGPISAAALLSLLGGFPATTTEGQRSQ